MKLRAQLLVPAVVVIAHARRAAAEALACHRRGRVFDQAPRRERSAAVGGRQPPQAIVVTERVAGELSALAGKLGELLQGYECLGKLPGVRSLGGRRAEGGR